MGTVRWEGPEIGEVGYAPPVPLCTERDGSVGRNGNIIVESVEGPLRKATRTLRLMRHKEHKWEEEEYRHIAAKDERDTAAVKELPKTHPEVRGPVDKEVERGEPGTATYERGKVLTKACGDCGRTHGRGDCKCTECAAKLPWWARHALFPTRRAHVEPGEDEHWTRMALIGENFARCERINRASGNHCERR